MNVTFRMPPIWMRWSRCTGRSTPWWLDVIDRKVTRSHCLPAMVASALSPAHRRTRCRRLGTSWGLCVRVVLLDGHIHPVPMQTRKVVRTPHAINVTLFWKQRVEEWARREAINNDASIGDVGPCVDRFCRHRPMQTGCVWDHPSRHKHRFVRYEPLSGSALCCVCAPPHPGIQWPGLRSKSGRNSSILDRMGQLETELTQLDHIVGRIQW